MAIRSKSNNRAFVDNYDAIFKEATSKLCPDCRGSGQEAHACDQGHYGIMVSCSRCGGTGEKLKR